MKFTYAYLLTSVFTVLLCMRPPPASSLSTSSETDETKFTTGTHNKQGSTGKPFSLPSLSTVADATPVTGKPPIASRISKTIDEKLPDKTEYNLTDRSSPGVTNRTIPNATGNDVTVNSIIPTSSTKEKETAVNSHEGSASNASNSTSNSNSTSISSESGGDSTTRETTFSNSSISGTTQCPDMCSCPQYDYWAAYLVPYLRQQLGHKADNYTDYIMKLFLLQQFAVNAESPKSILGVLFQRVYAQGNAQAILSLWWTRFGITACSIKPDTTFYLNAAMEERLFPQTKFKPVQIDLIAKALNDQTLGSSVDPLGQRVESYQLYNITFACKKGAKVVLSRDTSLFRYGRWSSAGCQVSTEGVLTLHRNWSLVELSVTNENVLWLQNISVAGIKDSTVAGSDNNKNESDIPYRNDTMLNSTYTGTIFPRVQEVSVTNASLSLQQLDQVFVWFQKAEQLSLKNNRLANFNCSELTPSPANWNTLVLSFNGLTSVPPCILRNSLESLDLSSNSISNISVFQFPRYVPCPKMDSLNLSNNSIRDVGIFADLNLMFLYLSGNQISSLNKLSFTRLPHLSVLDLSHNLLHQLDPGSFKSLIYLQILDLQHNYLQEFDRTVSPLRLDPPLNCTINLSYNRFSHPPFQRDGYNSGIALIVNAMRNPFACDCAMSVYIHATKNSSLTESYSSRSDMQCMYPAYLRGRPLDDIAFNDTCPVVSDCPTGCTCTLHRNDSIVTVVCSDADHFHFPDTFPLNRKLRLEFQSANKSQTFTTFRDGEYLQRVVSINASGRGLLQMPDFLCEALQQANVLDLSYNRLRRLPACFQSRPKDWPVLELRLAHNPWSCDCDAANLSSWLAEMMDGKAKNGVRVSDAREVWCSADTGAGVRVAEWDSSHCSPISYLPWVVTLAVVLALAAILGPLLYVYRLKAMVTLHARFHIRPFTRVPHYDEEDYDHEVLVVHGASNAGVDWVLNTLLPRTQNTHHRTCIPDRDFLLGASMAESYAYSVARAKATLCLLNPDAARDEWWLYAFQLARAENARHPHRKFLLVLLENVDVTKLPEEVREFIESNTYLSVEDKWFWKKLFYYLPDPPKVRLLK